MLTTRHAVRTTPQVELLADYHAGAIVTLNTMPDAHLAVTAGADGSVRCYDYANADVHATQIFSRRFNTPITSACYLPKIKDEAQRFMIVGFADGMVRVVMRCADDFKLVSVFKPHKSPVVAMAANGKQLATIAKDGTVFFFKNTTPSTFTPIAYTSITGRPSCCAWDSRGKALLVGCLTGELIELEAPVEVDTSKTFELPDLPRREFQFRMLKPPKPKKEKKKKKKGGEGEGAALLHIVLAMLPLKALRQLLPPWLFFNCIYYVAIASRAALNAIQLVLCLCTGAHRCNFLRAVDFDMSLFAALFTQQAVRTVKVAKPRLRLPRARARARRRLRRARPLRRAGRAASRRRRRKKRRKRSPSPSWRIRWSRTPCTRCA